MKLQSMHLSERGMDGGAGMRPLIMLVWLEPGLITDVPQMLRDLIHPRSPYDGFDADAIAPQLQGWGSTDPIFQSILEQLNPKQIIEVGSWKGLSAIHMARVMKSLGRIDFEILCVDTWLGSYEHWLERDDPHFFASLALVNGYPTLYRQFLTNVVKCGQDDVITPFPLTSGQAAIFLERKGVQADFIYIDAAHDEDGVRADLVAYWPLLREGGVLLGDDYDQPPLAAAADKFAKETGIPLGTVGNKFLLVKG